MTQRRMSGRLAVGVAFVCGMFTSALAMRVAESSAAEASFQKLPPPLESGQKGGPIFELRMYKIKPGMMPAYLENMRKNVVPHQEGIGLRHAGHFTSRARESTGTPVKDETTYIWMRAYKDEETLNRQYPEYYQSQWFKDHTKADAGKYLAGHEIIWMNPTDYSQVK